MNASIKNLINKLISLLNNNPWVIYFFLALFVFRWYKPNSLILGGDFSWSLFFSNFYKYTKYLWDASVNTGYPATRQLASFYPYATWGYFIELITHSSVIVQRIIFYISFVISGLGMYLFSKKLNLRVEGSFIAGIIYMFSPFASIVAWIPSYGMSFPFYCFLPLSLYFLIKILCDKDISKVILSFMGIILLYQGASNSNPAYIIVFIFFTLLITLLFLLINQNKKRFLRRYLLFLTLYILFNLFWILPFSANIQTEYEGANNEPAGLINDVETMKLNSVSMPDAFRITGFWVLQGEEAGDYYYNWHEAVKSPIYICFSFLLMIFILLQLFATDNKKQKKIVLFMILVFILGILLNSGFKTDGMLEDINKIIFSSDFVVRGFRNIFTKVGILLVFPWSFLIASSLDFFIKKMTGIKKVAIIIFLSLYILIIGLPLINGDVIKKDGLFLPSQNVRIPEEYYSLKEFDSVKKLDFRYISFPLPKSYGQSLKWLDGGFNGADFIRTFLNRPIIYQNSRNFVLEEIVKNINDSQKNIVDLFSFLNIKFVLQHEDVNRLVRDRYLTQKDFSINETNNILSNRYFRVSDLNTSKYLPHIYTPKSVIVADQYPGVLSRLVDQNDYQIRIAAYLNNTTKNNSKYTIIADFPHNLIDLPQIEYKKISFSKYRISIHQAKEVFPLVFSESFHEGWKAYLEKPNTSSKIKDQGSKLDNYKILDGNEEDQASKEELASFIEKGWLTTLGDGKEKKIEHKKYVDGNEKLDYVEKYKIDFVSKNFQGTIQNDNLLDGPIWETWLPQIKNQKSKIKNILSLNKDVVQLPDENHLMVNGYANSWIIDPNEVCKTGVCKKNEDGSYDMELVVEFWPQRLFYVGLGISGMTLLGCISYLVYDRFRKKKVSKYLAVTSSV